MAAVVWGPLGQGLLTGRVRKNQHNDLRRAGMVRHLTDERRLDVVERLIPLAGLDVALTDDILDRIDEIVPPGTDIGTLDQAYEPPALQNPDLRRRPLTARAAA